MKRISTLMLLIGLLLGTVAEGQPQEKTSSGTASPRCAASLAAPIEDNAKTQVLILGTPHLRSLKDEFRPSQLDSLIKVLAEYKPDLIGVESMSGTLIGELEREGGAYKDVIEQFAKERVEQGHAAQKLLGLNRDEAAQKVASSWNDVTKANPKDAAQKRAALVVTLVAAYDINTALLQWSYVPEDVRKTADMVPPAIAEYLNGELEKGNEVPAVSIRLAHTLGLQQLESVDDYEYVDLFASIADKFVEELQKDPRYQATAKSDFYGASDKAYHQAAQNGDLLPYYLYLNSEQYSSTDVQTQWDLFFKTHLPSGFDRANVALWEVRNLEIAAHIRKATALHPGKKMLVVFGAAHRPFLAAYLSQMMDVNIVNLNQIVPATVRAMSVGKGN